MVTHLNSLATPFLCSGVSNQESLKFIKKEKDNEKEYILYDADSDGDYAGYQLRQRGVGR